MALRESRTLVALAFVSTLLAGCEVKDANAPAADTAADTKGVVVETTNPAQPPAKMAALASQPGPNGITVDLNKAAVTGDVLTVQFTVHGPTDEREGLYMPIDQINLIDDATAQRYSLLKDNAGNPMASPLSGNQVGAGVGKGDSAVVWFKFPAPPVSSKTISINLPQVAPFDGVPVTR